MTSIYLIEYTSLHSSKSVPACWFILRDVKSYFFGSVRTRELKRSKCRLGRSGVDPCVRAGFSINPVNSVVSI